VKRSVVQGGSKRGAGKSLLSDLEGSLRLQSQPALEALEQEKQELLARMAQLEKQAESAQETHNEALKKLQEEFGAKVAELEKERLGLLGNIQDANAQIAKSDQLNQELKGQLDSLSEKEKQAAEQLAALNASLLAVRWVN